MVSQPVYLDRVPSSLFDETRSASDFTQRWIINDNWTYTADISPFRKVQQRNPSDKTLLVFYGIDTIANIVRLFCRNAICKADSMQTLAGQPVAWVNNEFQQYVFDVSSLLASSSATSSNTNLTLTFESAWLY